MKIRGGGAEGAEYFVPENEWEADEVTGIQCRTCLCAADACLCHPPCCRECGGPGLLVNGEPACPRCDSWPASARWPLTGKDKLYTKRFLKTCGEHQAFDPDEEPTQDIPKGWKP